MHVALLGRRVQLALTVQTSLVTVASWWSWWIAVAASRPHLHLHRRSARNSGDGAQHWWATLIRCLLVHEEGTHGGPQQAS